VRRYRRFSCAGFVLDAHRQVEINLLLVDEEALQALPEVDEQMLVLAYPDANRRRLHRLGVPGNGPWRIILAGYVFHALDRTSQQIRDRPYQAKPGDERF